MSPPYCLVLHAGTSDACETDPERVQDIEQILHLLATSAGDQLRSGIRALDVVQFVVAALEDCPLFDAGKGAALNVEGSHEVGDPTWPGLSDRCLLTLAS